MKGRIVAFGVALLGCSVHVPELTDGLCARVETEAYTAGENECLLLEDLNGLTLFKYETSESCGGPPCLRLEPGQTGYVLEKARPGTPAQWQVTRGVCAAVPQCGESVTPE